jgi:hypothetical protein
MRRRSICTPSSRPTDRRLPWAVSCLVLSLATAGEAGAAIHLTAARVPGAGAWHGPQFVQADAAGRVSLLRCETLQVYPVTRQGALGEPAKLERLPTSEEDPFIRDAALAPDGGDWLLLDVVAGPRLFHLGKEQVTAELQWQPTAVALPRGQALVAVFPAPTREIQLRKAPGGRVVLDAKEPPPVLVRLGASGWSTLVRDDYDFGSSNWPEAHGRMHLMREARLAAERTGAVWIAEEYGYRLRHFSPAGKLLAELTTGKGKPAVRERSAAEVEQHLARAEHGAGQRPNPASVRFTAPRAVDGLAAAKDGRVYIVVEPAGEGNHAPLALDRFDPARLTLERVLVDGIAESGRVSVAIGRDALYIAPFSGTAGLWRLSWEQLDAAKWERVGDARLNGEPLPAD